MSGDGDRPWLSLVLCFVCENIHPSGYNVVPVKNGGSAHSYKSEFVDTHLNH